MIKPQSIGSLYRLLRFCVENYFPALFSRFCKLQYDEKCGKIGCQIDSYEIVMTDKILKERK